MKKEELLEHLDKYSDIIYPPIIMSEANSPISIFTGEYTIETKAGKLIVSGVIQYNWVPNSGVKFSGKILDATIKKFQAIQLQQVKVFIANELLGEGYITKSNINSEIEILGVISQQAIIGDITIPVEKLEFAVPNFREFHGMTVKRIHSNGISIHNNRLLLENEKFLIHIDKCFNYSNLQASLEEKGGYIIQHAGEIIPKKGSITYDDAKEIIHCLDTFLSFLNGRRTSAIFFHGKFNDQTIWKDFTDYNFDSFCNFVPSWPAVHSIEGINEAWKTFSKLWLRDKEDKNFLISAIHWYIEANNSSGFTEGSIIMAQTGLELIYNWYIIEQKKLIIGKDSESINAANKIRLLISQLNLSYSIPKKFTQLQSFLDNKNNIIDAPDVIVQIRNSIVHSQEEKRKKLSEIHFKAKYQALQLCIYYMEMSLLKILNFNSEYCNRCSENMATSGRTELVPWLLEADK